MGKQISIGTDECFQVIDSKCAAEHQQSTGLRFGPTNMTLKSRCEGKPLEFFFIFFLFLFFIFLRVFAWHTVIQYELTYRSMTPNTSSSLFPRRRRKDQDEYYS